MNNSKNHGFKKHSPHARIEAAMLADMGTYIAAPEVLECGDDFIRMEKIPYSGPFSEEECAKALAKMHSQKQARFGYAYDTTIGPFMQPNPGASSWPLFFANNRVLYMARRCLDESRLSPREFERLQRFGADFTNYLPQSTPSMVHGDLWGGNVMNDGTQTVLIDPALYFGSYEYDIAFSTLFHTFSPRFYEAYAHYLPLDEDFFANRADIYNLYGLLVHLRAFGQMYKPAIMQTLTKFGY